MVIAFMIINTSNVIIVPKGYELGFVIHTYTVYGYFHFLLLAGPGRFSIEWNIIKCELVPGGKEVLQYLK